METRKMNRYCVVLSVIFLVLVVFSSEAFPWGFATHAYIDDHIGKKSGLSNANEIYGGLAPDIFNYLFEFPEYLAFLSDQTHHQPEKVWNAAGWGLEKSVAFGFVSHNDTWGADFTAHHACLTCGQAQGYAIAKAIDLLTMAPLPPDLGIPDEIAGEIFHEIVENSVDILIKRADPAIGQKIVSAALLRSPRFPQLLVNSYGKDFAASAGISESEAAAFIISAEKEFRKSMVLYGMALMQDEETAIELIAEQTADLAGSFLGSFGIPVPPREQIIEMVIGYMTLAISICESDHADEIKATIRFVDRNLIGNGISY